MRRNFTTYSGELCIYRVPGGRFCDKTKPERCYATGIEAATGRLLPFKAVKPPPDKEGSSDGGVSLTVTLWPGARLSTSVSCSTCFASSRSSAAAPPARPGELSPAPAARRVTTGQTPTLDQGASHGARQPCLEPLSSAGCHGPWQPSSSRQPACALASTALEIRCESPFTAALRTLRRGQRGTRPTTKSRSGFERVFRWDRRRDRPAPETLAAGGLR